MNEPLVSVIVGVYNKARHVEACVQSVLAQTHRRFELIIVDDASTDDSAERIAAVKDPRIRFSRRTENSGRPAVPRNAGLRLAQGEFIAFLDADDLWRPAKLERQVACLATQPETGLVHTQCLVIDEAGRELHERHAGRPPLAGDCLLPLLEHCWVSISSVLVRKAVCAQVGFFDEHLALRGREDYDWLLRAAVATRFGMVAECLTAYRLAGDSLSHGGRNWQAAPRDYLSHRDAWVNPERWGGRVTSGRLREIAFGAAEENAYHWRARREYGKAAWFAGQMLRLAPGDVRGWRQLIAAAVRRGP